MRPGRKLRHPVPLKRSRPKRCENSLAECHSHVSGQYCITITRIALTSNSRRVAGWLFIPSQQPKLNVFIFLKSCLASLFAINQLISRGPYKLLRLAMFVLNKDYLQIIFSLSLTPELDLSETLHLLSVVKGIGLEKCFILRRFCSLYLLHPPPPRSR